MWWIFFFFAYPGLLTGGWTPPPRSVIVWLLVWLLQNVLWLSLSAFYCDASGCESLCIYATQNSLSFWNIVFNIIREFTTTSCIAFRFYLLPLLCVLCLLLNVWYGSQKKTSSSQFSPSTIGSGFESLKSGLWGPGQGSAAFTHWEVSLTFLLNISMFLPSFFTTISCTLLCLMINLDSQVVQINFFFLLF